MKLTVITVMLFCTGLVLCSLWGDRRKALTWLLTSMKNKLFMKTFSYLCLSAFLCCCLCACGHLPYPRVLQQADSLAETCPDSACAWLAGWADSVRLMPERVQMRYRLLAVKAADKAYVRHTSDSVIRMAVDYFENHRDEALLPEAYYYAGRVYSDLGNAPQALDYFGKAARALPPQGGERLAERIYSQMGTLFSYRKMYREALEMYRKACECDKALKDTVGLIFAWRTSGNPTRAWAVRTAPCTICGRQWRWPGQAGRPVWPTWRKGNWRGCICKPNSMIRQELACRGLSGVRTGQAGAGCTRWRRSGATIRVKRILQSITGPCWPTAARYMPKGRPALPWHRWPCSGRMRIVPGPGSCNTRLMTIPYTGWKTGKRSGKCTRSTIIICARKRTGA